MRDRQASEVQGARLDVPRQPPQVRAAWLLPERRVLQEEPMERQFLLESYLQKAVKAWSEVQSWPRIELSRRVWISLRPGLRAYPPSAFHFPAAAEWGF